MITPTYRYSKEDLEKAYNDGRKFPSVFYSFDNWYIENDPYRLREEAREKYFNENAEECPECGRMDILDDDGYGSKCCLSCTPE